MTTGYFTTKCVDGRWQLIDSNGKPVFSLGMNGVYNQIIDQSAWLRVDFVDKYGADANWLKRWADDKLRQVKGWGFNTLGAWHEKYYWGDGTPKTVEIRMSRFAKKANFDWGIGFPDVFDKSFKASVYKALAECFYEKGEDLLQDRGLIGYYTDNELHWWGSSGKWGDNDPDLGYQSTGLVDDYFELAPHAAGKQAWVQFIADKYGSIERLNEAWGSEYLELDDLLYIAVYRAKPNVLEEDKTGFLRRIAEVYFSTTNAALRLYDPHRLNLGCRMVGTSTPPVVLEVMKEYADLLSLNFYSFELPEKWLQAVSQMMNMPIMITEFSFCAGREAGYLKSTNGARNVLVRDQARRAEAYSAFVNRAASLPYMVGVHWFALYDYANPDGLIGNYGCLDMHDEPWEQFVAAITPVNAALNGR
ncbi:hypothetical protein B1A99_15460 [Cohnella sp. CIP 111063]|uniref:hypothetical protein n=1 Tax=unclassified Cohnella TaxID=2636738 RepID=UPI000B8C3342|nr:MULTISPECIES: hypothetical protein [unclassified Cohnella]OXS58026.1 hypothetical protein B1A99_15460 [Cohnella sp. CIP 111063]PRX71361.1 hypothetical protein B0G52_109159 [Cohnella sp. SGD-V74]